MNVNQGVTQEDYHAGTTEDYIKMTADHLKINIELKKKR